MKEKMKDEEFTLEALERIMPDTSWQGEMHHDEKSVENLRTFSKMMQIMLRELTEFSYVPEGNKNDGYYRKIAYVKQSIIWGAIDYLKEIAIEPKDLWDE